jgi:hypothetical protein
MVHAARRFARERAAAGMPPKGARGVEALVGARVATAGGRLALLIGDAVALSDRFQIKVGPLITVGLGLPVRVERRRVEISIPLMSRGLLIDGHLPHASQAADAVGAPAYDPTRTSTDHSANLHSPLAMNWRPWHGGEKSKIRWLARVQA